MRHTPFHDLTVGARSGEQLNQYRQHVNYNRPSRQKTHHFYGYRWNIPTLSSRPHSCSHTISQEIVSLVLTVRDTLKRCAEVVWHHLTTVLNVLVSLSSENVFSVVITALTVPGNPESNKTTQNDHQSLAPANWWVTDTIHHVDPNTGKRLYYYTAIDSLHEDGLRNGRYNTPTRVGSPGCTQGSNCMGIPHCHGAETTDQNTVGTEQRMESAGMTVRYSRLHRPN